MIPSRTSLRWSAALFAAVFSAACGDTTVAPSPDVVTSDDVAADGALGDATPLDAASDATPLDAASDATPLDAASDATPLDTVAPSDAGRDVAADILVTTDAARDVTTDSATPSDGPRGCTRAADCPGAGAECVFPTSGCASAGVCMTMVACLRAETFCGCDGVTYEACRPNRSTRAMGPCGGGADAGADAPPSACRSNADCGARSFCAAASCDGPGACAPRPEACPDIFSPVCGCDGRTYGNECEARGAGARVASRGACASADAGVDAGDSFCARALCAPGTRCCEATRMCQPPGLLCPLGDAGVIPDVALDCASNADCGADQYCAGSGCGTRGACAPRPLGCAAIFAPVCGCDGRTYSNECSANAAGQRAASRGACAEPDAGTSFCATVRCAATTYCCEARRACIPLGEACSASGTCRDDSQCAGVDRGYACCAGTGRCYDTRCLACCMTVTPGCGSNADCRDDQYCAGAGCGTRGACAPRPTFCTRDLNPQCGCDRMTYSNPCAAAAAGVRVAAPGACP